MRMLTEKRQRQKAERRWTMCIFPLDYVSRHKTKLPSCVCEVPREWHTHELLLQLTHNKDEINVLSAAYRWTSGLWPWYQHYLPQPGNSLAILQVSGCPDVMPRIKCCQALGGEGTPHKADKTMVLPKWFPLEVEQFWYICCLRSGCSWFLQINGTMWNLFW